MSPPTASGFFGRGFPVGVGVFVEGGGGLADAGAADDGCGIGGFGALCRDVGGCGDAKAHEAHGAMVFGCRRGDVLEGEFKTWEADD